MAKHRRFADRAGFTCHCWECANSKAWKNEEGKCGVYGIPDEADYHMEQKRDVPSWRRVCKSLLRNDYWCKGLGFSQQKSTAYKSYLERIKREREADEEFANQLRLPIMN